MIFLQDNPAGMTNKSPEQYASGFFRGIYMLEIGVMSFVQAALSLLLE